MELKSINELARHFKMSWATIKNVIKKHMIKGYGDKYKKYDVQDVLNALSQ